MRKQLTLLIAVFFSLNAIASADLFEIDYSAIATQFKDISSLEDYLNENPETTLSQLKEANHELADLVEDFDRSPARERRGNTPFGFPPFIIGCGFAVLACCIGGLVGVLIVSIATGGDREQVRQAYLGCFLGSLISAVLWFQISNT